MRVNIPYIAGLAKLRIAEEELPKLQQEMEAIITMVENLPDTSFSYSSVAGDSMELREDAVSAEAISSSEMLRNAPKVRSGCVAVPKAVE